MAKTNDELLAILSQFALEEKVVSAEPFGNGHINDTLKVTTDKGEIKYVLQRINHLVFTNVEMLQHNIHVVTTHIREKLEIDPAEPRYLKVVWGVGYKIEKWNE